MGGSALPAFLAQDPGVESGLAIAQVTAVDLLTEMRVLAHPASVDTVTTSANKEDHVSMGMAAARKARGYTFSAIEATGRKIVNWSPTAVSPSP